VYAFGVELHLVLKAAKVGGHRARIGAHGYHITSLQCDRLQQAVQKYWLCSSNNSSGRDISNTITIIVMVVRQSLRLSISQHLIPWCAVDYSKVFAAGSRDQ
jgi:hypothetical protein